MTRSVRFAIYPDTNCLLDRKADSLVKDDFTQVYDELAADGDVTLLLADIVRKELIFRKKQQCISKADSARASLESLRQISRAQVPIVPAHSEIDSLVDDRLAEWCQERTNVVELQAPIETINWRRLIQDAVERIPPFEQEKEKGFRDRLILEILLGSNLEAFDWIFFISNDDLMKTGAELIFRNQPTIRIVASVGECANEIRLRREQKTEELIKALMPKASEVFYSDNEVDCLWFKFNLGQIFRHDLHVALERSFGTGIGLQDGMLTFGKNSLVVAPIVREKIFLGDSVAPSLATPRRIRSFCDFQAVFSHFVRPLGCSI